jgi:hypothetical protein
MKGIFVIRWKILTFFDNLGEKLTQLVIWGIH